jgi:ring-1,2-phenylacetyl-CoA epoxidase subunit PaaD
MAATEHEVRALLDAVVDPEIPVLSIADLGILRGVGVTPSGEVTVTVTPTYSGCPAMDYIRTEIERVLGDAGLTATVETTLTPAWTTEWMSEGARDKLHQYGIAPPRGAGQPILCPRCRGEKSRLVAEFGSTACKALRVCSGCGEPFDHFKDLQ